MANLHRLIVLSLLLLAQHAHAAFPATPSQVWSTQAAPVVTGTDPLPVFREQACRTSGVMCPPTVVTMGSQTADQPGYRSWVALRNGSNFGNVISLNKHSTAYVCPANSTVGGSNCTCNSGYIENEAHNACVVEPSQKELLCQGLEGQSTGPLTHSGSSTGTICDESGYAGSYGGGCTATRVPSMTVTVTLPGQPPVTSVEGIYTGGVCQGSSPTLPPTTGDPATPTSGAPPSEENPCPNGQPGSVNGVSVCVPYPPGTKVEGVTDSSVEVTNSDGTKTATTKTTEAACANGVCTVETTTTVTQKNSSGVVTGTTTTSSTGTVPKGEFCASNPGAQQCSEGDESSFGGACAGGFTCKGDAVQCAIAREVYVQNCKWNDTSSAEHALYQSKKGATGDQTTALPGNQTVALSGSSFDTTDAIGGAAGLSDLTVQVWHSDVSLPLSNLNPWLSAFGNLLMFITALVCARIVIRG